MKSNTVSDEVMAEMMECLDSKSAPSPKLQSLIDNDEQVAKTWQELKQLEGDLQSWTPEKNAPSPSVDFKKNIMAALPDEPPQQSAVVKEISSLKEDAEVLDGTTTSGRLFFKRVAIPFAVAVVFGLIMMSVDPKQPVPPEHLNPAPQMKFAEILPSINGEKIETAIKRNTEKVSSKGRSIGEEAQSLLSLPTKLLPGIPVAKVEVESSPVELNEDQQSSSLNRDQKSTLSIPT